MASSPPSLMRFEDLVVVPAGLRLRDVTFGIDAFPDRLELTPIHLASGGGTLDATLVLRGTSPGAGASMLDGRVRLKDFRLLDRRDARVNLTGDVALRGTLGRPEVSGRITVDDGRISPDFGGRTVHGTGLPEGVVFVGVGGEPSMASRAPPSRGLPIAIDLAIVVPPRTLQIKNSLIDAFLSANLAVRSRPDGLALEGVVSVVKGTIDLYGRTFTLRQDSTVVFDGSTDINPRLAVKADFDIRHVDLSSLGLTAGPDSRVLIDVSGTARAPQVTFGSSPAMAETDVVAIIALGAPLGTTSGQQSAVASQTTNLVAGFATGTLTRLLKVDLPVDVFQVGNSPGAATGTEITVGKRITRDLLVLYKANVGTAVKDINRHQVEVEYDITRYLEVRTSYGDAGQGALDLLFRWRY
jgi:translocation and assembly module TamB